MARMPTRNPNTPRMATTSVSIDNDRERDGAGVRTSGSARSVAAVTESLEAVEDVDGRRPEDHDEEGRKNAEHHRQQHLDRGLLRPLLGQLLALDAHLVS